MSKEINGLFTRQIKHSVLRKSATNAINQILMHSMKNNEINDAVHEWWICILYAIQKGLLQPEVNYLIKNNKVFLDIETSIAAVEKVYPDFFYSETYQDFPRELGNAGQVVELRTNMCFGPKHSARAFGFNISQIGLDSELLNMTKTIDN